MAILKHGQPIIDLSDWEERAGPKRTNQWREDRSAMEVARCWLSANPSLPAEVIAVLSNHPAFGAVKQWEAEPEVRFPFDQFPGETRNTDLAVYAKDEFGEFVLAVEAKADEPFGETVADALTAAIERKLEIPNSNGVARIEQLVAALFGSPNANEATLGELRYQLLTATAGALKAGETRGATSRVVLLIQEFRTRQTDDSKHAANAMDLNRFVRCLSHETTATIEPGVLSGPFAVPGAPLFRTPASIFIGKVCHNLRNSGA